jgi:hypothetical protein
MQKDTELMPCLSGEALCRQPKIQPLLQELKALVSAPADVYQQLYRVTCNAFAEFCQAMPFTLQQPEPYGLLQRQFTLAITALKLRRGRMLPQHSESECIAEQEPLWTYAVFTAALFTGLTRLQQDRDIALYRSGSEKIGQGSVLAGSLFEPKTYYKVSKPLEQNTQLIEPSHYIALLVGRIIPAYALRWLTHYPSVFSSWWQAITVGMHAEKKDGLLQLIAHAAEKIDYPLQEEKGNVEKNASTSSPLQALKDLTHWLQQLYQTQGCETQKEGLLRVPSGLFIDRKRLPDFLMAYPEHVFPEHLLKCLEDYLWKEKDSIWHRYRSSCFEKRLVLEGVILQAAYLPPLLQSLPMQSHFVLDIPL